MAAIAETAANQNAAAAKAAQTATEKSAMRDPYGRFAKDAEKQDDDILDKLLGNDPAEETPAEAKEPKAKAKESESDNGADKEAEKPKVGKRALEKARTALELDGWEDEDFEGLTEERIVSLGKKASERQTRISKELEARAKQAKSEPGEASEEEKPSARVANRAEPGSQEDDLDSLKPFSELFGEEPTSAIAKYVKSATEASRAKIAELEARLAAMADKEAHSVAEQARAKVSERFADLKDDDVWDEVIEDMELLAQAKPGRFKSMESLMEAACRLRGFDEAKPSEKAEPKTKSPEVSKAKANGITSAKSIQVPAKALSLQEREDRALDELLKGRGLQAAKNAYDG